MKLYGKRYIHKGLLPDNIEKQRKDFIPEVEPELIEYNDKFFNIVFPRKQGVDTKKYQLTNIGQYSIFFPRDADTCARIVRSFFPKDAKVTMTDANSNMGGATMAFANHFDKVNAVEIVPLHCRVLENNLTNYGVIDKVKIHCADYLDVADDLEQDAVFFDPPWGGPDYKNEELFNMYLDEINISDIIKSLLDKNKVKIVSIRVPFNYDFKQILKLTRKSYVYTFTKSNGQLKYFFIVLKK